MYITTYYIKLKKHLLFDIPFYVIFQNQNHILSSDSDYIVFIYNYIVFMFEKVINMPLQLNLEFDVTQRNFEVSCKLKTFPIRLVLTFK